MALATSATASATVACRPCPPHTWSPVDFVGCKSCASEQFCSSIAVTGYYTPASLAPRSDTLNHAPLVAGDALLPVDERQTLTRRYTYVAVGLAVIAVASVCVLLLWRGLRVRAWPHLRKLDYLFLLDHQQEIGEPFTPYATALGGLCFLVFVVFAVFSLVFLLHTHLASKYVIGDASSTGFSELSGTDISADVTLALSISFVAIDNAAACADVCATGFVFSPEQGAGASARCATSLHADNTTCTIRFASAVSSVRLPSAFYCQITMRNSLAHAISYDLSALRYRGRAYGLVGQTWPLVAETVLFGAAPTTLALKLTPFVFDASAVRDDALASAFVEFASPALSTLGHLVGLSGQEIGATMNASQLAAADAARQVQVLLKFQRTTTTLRMRLESSLVRGALKWRFVVSAVHDKFLLTRLGLSRRLRTTLNTSGSRDPSVCYFKMNIMNFPPLPSFPSLARRP